MVRKLIRRWATTKLEPAVDALEAGEPPYALMRDLAATFGLPAMVKAAFAKMAERAAGGSEGAKPVQLSGLGEPALSTILSIELS
ncbi:MAG: hypothetical protein JNL83_27655, partial [Myxococcales bacterium]|nr:hypothetical protein [Myxococcales bacterium]